MESFIVNVSKPKFESKLNHKELKLIGNVTLKVLEKLRCFEYDHLVISEAEMGILFPDSVQRRHINAAKKTPHIKELQVSSNCPPLRY